MSRSEGTGDNFYVLTTPPGTSLRKGSQVTAVRVRGLTKSYGGVRAVDGIELTIERGEVVAILGPNGAGKTTTVEMIEGLRRPDSGEIEVLGTNPATSDRSLRDRIGIVLQESGIEDELTVAEAITAQARPHSNPMSTEDAIAMIGLEPKRGERIKRLSGGQRRRLDLALAMDRATGHTTIRFRIDPSRARDLGVETSLDGVVEIATTDPVGVLARVTSEAITRDIALSELEVKRLTLEDAYLGLIGDHDG